MQAMVMIPVSLLRWDWPEVSMNTVSRTHFGQGILKPASSYRR